MNNGVLELLHKNINLLGKGLNLAEPPLFQGTCLFVLCFWLVGKYELPISRAVMAKRKCSESEETIERWPSSEALGTHGLAENPLVPAGSGSLNHSSQGTWVSFEPWFFSFCLIKKGCCESQWEHGSESAGNTGTPSVQVNFL